MLNCPAQLVTLAANLSEISRHTRNYGSETNYMLIFAAVGLLTVLSVVIYAISTLARFRNSTPTAPAAPLLGQITAALGLSEVEANMISRLASRNGIQPPEVLFIDPGLWGPSLESFPHERGPMLELMEKLFGPDRCRGLRSESNSVDSV